MESASKTLESTGGLAARGWHYYHVIATPAYKEWMQDMVDRGNMQFTPYSCKCSVDGTEGNGEWGKSGNHIHHHLLVMSNLSQGAIRFRLFKSRQARTTLCTDRSRVKKIVCDLHLLNTIHYLRCEKGQKGHVHFELSRGKHSGSCNSYKAKLRAHFRTTKEEHILCECQKTFDTWIRRMKEARLKKAETRTAQQIEDSNRTILQLHKPALM